MTWPPRRGGGVSISQCAHDLGKSHAKKAEACAHETVRDWEKLATTMSWTAHTRARMCTHASMVHGHARPPDHCFKHLGSASSSGRGCTAARTAGQPRPSSGRDAPCAPPQLGPSGSVRRGSAPPTCRQRAPPTRWRQRSHRCLSGRGSSRSPPPRRPQGCLGRCHRAARCRRLHRCPWPWQPRRSRRRTTPPQAPCTCNAAPRARRASWRAHSQAGPRPRRAHSARPCRPWHRPCA
mmetsp:Transcript_70398/g.222419  ORF Transcript_70398/g.222419 Transcript_70398/m.222419 type:complete len:237 (-) Transcript_70398:907-1617(-)